MKPAAALLLLLTLSSAQAQVPADWDQWVADGLTAEDNSEYKDAEKLFGQACGRAVTVRQPGVKSRLVFCFETFSSVVRTE